MPWCPNCKTEYRVGITVCADCGAALVDFLEETEYETLLAADNQTMAERLATFLHSEGISKVNLIPHVTEDAQTDCSPSPKIDVLVPSDQKKIAVKLARAFLEVEQEKTLETLSPEELAEMADQSKQEKEAVRNAHTYVKAEERFKESQSTAYLFFGFGIALAIFCLLNFLGVFHLISGAFSHVVILALCVVFVYIGVSSMKHASTLKAQIDSEADTAQKIKEWLNANITSEKLAEAADSEAGQEANDIFRFDYVKEELMKAYPDLDDNFADTLVDEFLS